MKFDNMFQQVPGLLEHSLRVVFYTRHIIDYLPDGLITRIQAEDLLTAALLHDVGKSTWPIAWFVKPRHLIKNSEWTVMQAHPLQSMNVLCGKGISVNAGVQKLILQHHERLGGKGYPYQVEPDFVSQILAAADVFAACTEERPYRDRVLTADKALYEVACFSPIILIDP